MKKLIWPQSFINKIICGDSLSVMKEMPSESIDMVMTSPPYWGLRDYGTEQIFGGDPDCEHEWGNQLSHPKQEKRTIKQLRSSSGLSWNRGENASIFKWQEYSPKNQGNFCLKCQAWKGQLGLEPTPEMYIEHLTIIFNEAKRVLKKEGSLWLNMGDTYWSTKGSCYNPGDGKNSIETRRKENDVYPLYRGNKSDVPNLSPKCLAMIPERLSWSLIQNGWILRNKIIWYKPNSMPSSVKDRFSNRWEGLFFFVKSSKPVYWTNRKTRQLVAKKPLGIKGQEGIDWEWEEVGVVDKNIFNVRVRDADKERFMQKATEKEKKTYGKSKLKKASLWTAHDYYFDLDAVREPHKYDGRKDTLYKGGPKDMQIGKHERWPNPAGKNPGDVIKVDRKWNEVPGQESQSIARDHTGWFRKDGTSIVDFEKGKNPGDFWNINTQPFPEAHFAVFPETLCEKPIKAGCPEQMCKRCGKAKYRITKKSVEMGKSFADKTADCVRASPTSALRYKQKKIDIKTIGWASCNCNAGFESGTVFDPFAGSGTVGVMAKKLGRQFILIDIKKEYCEMAKKRITQVGYQMELRI